MRDVDVLVVGAGPTGLALAVQARAHGAAVRIVDRNRDRVHESRALAVQPRTLELLAGCGLAGTLVARGNPAVRLALHAGGREVTLPLFDLGMADTDYPFLLFVSQATTEQLLGEQLAAQGVTIEREVTLVDCEDNGSEVSCQLRGREGVERVRAKYVVGCDGAHSTVREQAGIRFVGDVYPQIFALADLEVDGLPPDMAHAYFGGTGPLLFFPLGEPATWRLIAMRPAAGWPGRGGDADDPVTLDDLQAVADAAAGGRLRLRDPVWLTDFRLHRRQAERYRAGRLFLAGDAAHVHSPAGAQGMNTGIQDAWNLGWKLALVTRGAADPALLDTYQVERAPVGRAVVRFTDRAFRAATSTNPLARFVRGWLVPRLAPLAWHFPRFRAAAFRTIAELAIHYRRSPAVQEGRPAPRRGPRAGDRLPDAPGTPGFHLLLCGPPGRWPAEPEVVRRYAGLLSVHHRTDEARETAHYLVRPDGYVAYRAAGTDLAGMGEYLSRWLDV
jgi:2-polyprenyl-6-methoxyphenol hydroxylase-like FAD-dependent oxidoreductase